MSVAQGDRRLLELTLELKGRIRRRRDWISIAEKARALSTESMSRAELATRLRVSRELLRALISLTDLPSEIQQMVRRGEILFDAAQRLNSIEDPGLRLRVARAIKGLPSHAQREAITFAKRNPERNLPGFLKRLSAPQDNEANIRFVVVSFSPEELNQIRAHSKHTGASVSDTIRKAAIAASRSG